MVENRTWLGIAAECYALCPQKLRHQPYCSVEALLRLARGLRLVLSSNPKA